MPVPPSKTRRGRPPGSTNKAKGNGSRAGRKMRRGSKPRGSISIADQERATTMLTMLREHLVNFARSQGFPYPSLWGQEAASMLTGLSMKQLTFPNGEAVQRLKGFA